MKNLLLFTIITITLGNLFVAGQVTYTGDTIFSKLELGKPIERELRAGDIHMYSIPLATGQYFRAVVEQQGIDVVVTLYDPGSEKIVRIDSPNGSQGPEPLDIEIDSSGIHYLEVKALERGIKSGHYEARIEEILSAEEYADHLEKERKNYLIVKKWIGDNAISIKTAEAGNGFEDLQPLKKLIGNSHIVALGEATHGTREFFQFKHRMLEFLVNEMGFTVFGIEASMPEGFDINEYILTGKGDPEKALAGLYFWTWNTEEVLDMIRWMRHYNEDDKHTRKIKFYGFDMQSTPRAFKETRKYLHKVDPELAFIMEEEMGILGNPFLYGGFNNLSNEKKEKIMTLTNSILERFDKYRLEYIKQSNESDWVLARQYVVIILQNLKMQVPPKGYYGVRDSVMAQNIRWIHKHEGPDTKMVVWAHNGHVATQLYPTAKTMGWHLRKMFGSDFVTIGFAFNQGSFQAREMAPSTKGLQSFTVDPMPDKTFDATLSEAGLSIAAINFHEIPKNGPVAEWFKTPHATRNIGSTYSEKYAKEFLGLNRPQKLTELYDAILFVEKTTSARPNESGRRKSQQDLLDAPKNLDFENGNVGKPPLDWISPSGLTSFNFQVETSSNNPRIGKHCSMIKKVPGKSYGETYGFLHQKVDAISYRDKKITLKAWVRVEENSSDDKAYLWLKVLKQGFGPQATIFYENMADLPITNKEWKLYEISAMVPSDAVTIDYGLGFVGDGQAYIDAVSLEAIVK